MFKIAEPDYSKVFKKYQGLPVNVRREFDDFSKKNYAANPPPGRMEEDLERIVRKYQTKVPVVTSKSPPQGQADNFYGLAAILAGIAILSGMPPPPMY